MKKLVLIVVLLLASCIGSATFSNTTFTLNLPQNWNEGFLNPGHSYVVVKVYLSEKDTSFNALRTDTENTMQSPEMQVLGKNDVLFTSDSGSGLSDIVISLGEIEMSKRDVLIEKNRLIKTGMKASDMIIEDLALGHVREMAFVLKEAKEQNILVADDVIEKYMKLAFLEVEKKGLTKEDFLGNWGITELEFVEINKYRLIYEQLVGTATADKKTDEEKNTAATQYLLSLESKYAQDEIKNGNVIKTFVRLILEDKKVALIFGGLYQDASESEVTNIIESFKFNNEISFKKSYLFSKR